MDSRESLAQPPQPPPQRHQAHHLHQHPMLSPAMMMPPNSYPTHHQQQHRHLQPNNANTAPGNNNNILSQESMQQRFNFDGSDQYGGAGDVSSPPGGFRASGFSIEPARKKRGRPRKYSPSPDGSIALGLAPAPVTTGSGGGHLESSNDGGGTPNTDSTAKKHRGRPPGSGKKQLDALGSPGVGFTPHVITVKAGEDIASKITAFSHQGPRTVCILSANGAISNVSLRQPAMSGGTVTYEGRFELISLSGSFMVADIDGNHSSRSSGLSVSLAGSDGRVLGGGVAGSLVAASPVQVIVGSFIVDSKKPKSSSAAAQPSSMLTFGGGSVPGASPPSDGPTSESSDDSGGSPVHRPSGSYNNANQQQQQPPPPQPQMPMYSNMGWPNSTMNMLRN
ncbi:AT-hook motif nuclear-localized protein 10-like [Rutidosis leptorrhynchoides]|uniref:AT-hook motif nuclear-localized protein 10-like n=1 Tax=Rutidosis leptorrhynchoides TaxID=125765 RepID=UPI003A98D8B4